MSNFIDCSYRKDIVLVLDASASVGSANFKLMVEYVVELVKHLTKGGQDHRFSLITYSTKVKTIFSFNRYDTPERVIQAMITMPYTAGATNTAGGLRQARALFDRSEYQTPLNLSFP